MNLKVHLVFGGNCEEAFNAYREVFDGEKNKIAHIVLNTAHFRTGKAER